MLHPVTRSFLRGLRPWLMILLILRLLVLLEPSPVLWSLHQFTAALAFAAGLWAVQRPCPVSD